MSIALEAYLDRTQPDDWRAAGAGDDNSGSRDGGGRGARTGGGSMTRDEAYEILGLRHGASAEEIKEAHKRLMLKMHPDQGGSTYLAARINEAKEVLLGRK